MRVVDVPSLERMYGKRVNGYANLGYSVKCEGTDPDKLGVLFDQDSFLEVLKKDIAAAKREVVIVSPFMMKSRVRQVASLLLPFKLNGGRVCVVTRPASDYKENQCEGIFVMIDDFRKSGFEVIEKSGIHQKYVIVDQEICWYGSLNLLSYGKNAQETMMRFVSRDVSEELLEILA